MSTSAERMRRMRERRAAGMDPGPGARLRDADELLAPAVEETIGALELGEDGQAAAQLARRYADVIDRARDPAYALRWLGPLLLDALAGLGATPAARARLAKGPKPAAQGSSWLSQLRGGA